MPKPENSDQLTPDQKRPARLDSWINHEGIEFAKPENLRAFVDTTKAYKL
jgi:hypothetical protein